MTQQDMYIKRAAQGATLTPQIREFTQFSERLVNADHNTKQAAEGITDRDTNDLFRGVEEIATAFQEKFYPNPQLYKIVDSSDVYLWRALADSEQATIDLINAARPQKAGAA